KKKNSNAEKENNPDAGIRCCIWTDVDDSVMVEQLKNRKDGRNQSGAGWKKQVWTIIQELLAKTEAMKGGKKTALKCGNHWANVCASCTCRQQHLLQQM
ncbi:hypothetical protein DFH94DRAFT_640155, partial [Russula ochroleuca]